MAMFIHRPDLPGYAGLFDGGHVYHEQGPWFPDCNTAENRCRGHHLLRFDCRAAAASLGIVKAEDKTAFIQQWVRATKNFTELTKASMNNPYGKGSLEECIADLGPHAYILDGEPYCPAVWDTVLCWPATEVNNTAYLPCPPIVGLDTSKNAFRVCGPGGLWQEKEPGVYTNETGYTEYRGCYTTEAREYYDKYVAGKSEAEREFMKDILDIARTLEIVGLSISLVATIISLGIFCYFRSLKCHRTLMHKHLFVAIIVQVSIQLVLYIDQLVGREVGGKVAGTSSGMSNSLFDTPILCEAMYSICEYTRTVKFMWMFLEGFYLHNMIAVSVFSGKPNYVIYFFIGWGVPMTITVTWVFSMMLFSDLKTRCWFGYYVNPLVWILQGPRTAIMVINLFFLLNIIRVLVMKLRDSQTNESNKLRKAVKAAIVLLPLLGLTNFVSMLEPDPKDNVKLTIYFLSEACLLAFEGFFISLIYCFLNGEVHSAIRRAIVRHTGYYATELSGAGWRNNTWKVRQAFKRQCERYRQHRIIRSSSARRMSRSLSIFTSFTEVPHPNSAQIKRQSSAFSNGVPDGVNGAHRTRFTSLFRTRQARRQSARDFHTARRSDIPEVPDIVESNGAATCKTDLMSEDMV